MSKKNNKTTSLLVTILFIISIIVFYPAVVYPGGNMTLTGGDWDIGDVGSESGPKTTTGNKWSITASLTDAAEDVYARVEDPHPNLSPGAVAGEDTFLLKGKIVNCTNGVTILGSDTLFLDNFPNTPTATNDSKFDLQFTAPTSISGGVTEGAKTITVIFTVANWCDCQGDCPTNCP